MNNRVSISLNNIRPAPEPPVSEADITGLFIGRMDNTILVQAMPFGAGVGGISGSSPVDDAGGIRVEVVVTSPTEIYRDITIIPAPVNGEIQNLQQAADEGTLEDLIPQTYISVEAAVVETVSLRIYFFTAIPNPLRNHRYTDR